MSEKWTFKYGSAAVAFAAAIIVISLLANPSMLPNPDNALATFAVMLTDPPVVPAGTSVLNITYSDVLLHITYPNETADWLRLSAQGTVNLFSLINVSQTLASTTVPVGSVVDRIQFNITDVEAIINGQTVNVTALSDAFVVEVADGYVNQSLSGVLLDFNPTLVEIQATDANGSLVNYYVLVPSASAVVIKDLDEEQVKVGTVVKISEKNKVKLHDVEENFKNNVKIVHASLSVNGNVTTLSIDLKNEGSFAFRVFGLTLHGEFNATRITPKNNDKHENNGKKNSADTEGELHSRTIPLKLVDTSLVPVFGERNFDNKKGFSSLTLQPGETVSLSFSGIIELQPDKGNDKHVTVIIPLASYDYELKLMGEGSQNVTIKATT